MIRQNGVFILAITFLSFGLPIHSVTWEEVFKALSQDKYDFPANAKNKNVTCWKNIYWEEYIEGDSYTSGYVKKFRKRIKINCP